MENKNTKTATKTKVAPKKEVKKSSKKVVTKENLTKENILEETKVMTEEVVKEPAQKTEVRKLVKLTKEERAQAMKEQAMIKRNRAIKNSIFWIIFICLAAIWVTDFIAVKKNVEPMFCLRKVVHQFEDGTVKECNGLGYNIYNYNRTNSNLKSQFSPFFVGFEK